MGCVLYEMASFRPPFMAHDIQGLRKKITAGHFERIPSFYSEELESLVRLCLTINPRERPSAEGLLHNNLIRKKLYLYPNEHFNKVEYEEMNKENRLMQTIKVPNRFNFGGELKNRLPKSNYENNSQLMKSDSSRNQSLVLNKNRSEERLPSLSRRHSSKESKDKCNVPKPRLVYLR